MYVGIDFGTAYTKIAYLDEKGFLRLFRYPGELGDEYIPTAIVYPDRVIGRDARIQFMNEPGVHYVEGFKMFLPSKDERELQKRGWTSDKSPHEVVRDYFARLLVDTRQSFFKRYPSPRRLILSVPQLWQKETNPGAEVLRHIFVDELQLPVDSFLSESVCAAAYYISMFQRIMKDEFQPFNLLVCDAGGGTFDVTLCRVGPGQIEVLDFDGCGNLGIGSAGKLFDRKAVERALEKAHETFSLDDFAELLSSFEMVKLAKHPEIANLFSNVWPYEQWEFFLSDTEIYRVRKKYTLTLQDVFDCFAEIAQTIETVVARLLHRSQKRGYTIDRITFLGGFAQFPLVYYKVLKTLGGIKKEEKYIEQAVEERLDRFGAIARGAALIASGEILPVEYYPHTVSLEVGFCGPDGVKLGFLPIVKAHEAEAGNEKIYWAQYKGKRAVIEVKNHANQACAPIPLYIQENGEGPYTRLEISAMEYPPPGRYEVGIRIEQSNSGTILFKSCSTGELIIYRLGNLNPTQVMKEDEK